MTPKTIRITSARPRHTIKAPRGFVPHRITLRNERKQREAAEANSGSGSES